jgi:hypothetical protein
MKRYGKSETIACIGVNDTVADMLARELKKQEPSVCDV